MLKSRFAWSFDRKGQKNDREPGLFFCTWLCSEFCALSMLGSQGSFSARTINGPVLTEVTYAGRSHDSKIDLR
jgi:hypothetical protein